MNNDADFSFRWAVPGDEPEIRALVGSVAMPGAVSVRFAREPDYFLGASIMGEPCDVLIARHRPDGRLAAMGCRAEHLAFVNGRESRLGYIGQIRVANGYRGAWLVQRGARHFEEASAPGLLYYGVIASDNRRARDLLTGRRLPGGVHVRRLCGITTYAILLRRTEPRPARGLDIQPASAAALPGVVDFLREHGPARQFFPSYALEDFTGGARMRGLAPEDIMVARRAGRVAGMMAAWDQAAYKQDIVEEYGPALRRLRPMYDAAAGLLGFSPLTPPGQAIPLAFAACTCIADDDAGVMQALLAACANHARDRGKAFLMLGLADHDPLLTAVRRSLHVTYHSDLYAASWSPDIVEQLDERVPYIEIATL
jgi:hypothetical protein